MVKSVAAELEDEQSDAATSSNIENLDVELDFVSRDSEPFADVCGLLCIHVPVAIIYLKAYKSRYL